MNTGRAEAIDDSESNSKLQIRTPSETQPETTHDEPDKASDAP